MISHRLTVCGILLAGLAASSVRGQAPDARRVQRILSDEGDRFEEGLVPGHVPASPDEPLATEFSLEKAARSMDLAALNWQMQPRQQCSQCHANMFHLVARPILAAVLRETPEVREMYEQHIVARRWEKHGLIYTFESVAVAVPLSFHDSRTTGTLHPQTRRALDRMIAAQEADGTWGDTEGGKYAFFRRYEQTLFAALGIAVAPDQYADTEQARRSLEAIRKYVRVTPPKHVYAQGMLLWAGGHIEGLATPDFRRDAIASLLRLQRDDGGWALRQLLADDKAVPSGKFAADLPRDGYGTGFAIFVLRKAGMPADDVRLARGVGWLKANQRETGRWFHSTLSTRPNHVLSNTATAWAVMALDACGQIPAR